MILFVFFGYIFILIGISQSQATSSNKQDEQYGGKSYVRGGYNIYSDNPSGQVQSPESTYTNVPTNYAYNNGDSYSNINKPASYAYNNADTYLNTPSHNYNPTYDTSYNNNYEGYSQSYGNVESSNNPEAQGVEYQSINVPSTFPIQTPQQELQVSHQFGTPQYAVDGNNNLAAQIQSQAALQSTQSQSQNGAAPQASYAAQQQSALNNVGNQNYKIPPSSGYTTADLLSGGDFSYGDLSAGGFGGFGGFNTDVFGSGGFGSGFGGGSFGSFGLGGSPYQHLFTSGLGGKLEGFNSGSQKGLSSLLKSKKRS